jgi:hypothetical protein
MAFQFPPCNSAPKILRCSQPPPQNPKANWTAVSLRPEPWPGLLCTSKRPSNDGSTWSGLHGQAPQNTQMTLAWARLQGRAPQHTQMMKVLRGLDSREEHLRTLGRWWHCGGRWGSAPCQEEAARTRGKGTGACSHRAAQQGAGQSKHFDREKVLKQLIPF